MTSLTTYRHSVLILILMAVTLLGSLPGLSSMQVIDRDEARFAQASIQMRDSGDYVNIRFHDRERHKKPVGIYWLQTASLKLFSSPQKRDIWVHRLPSVLAGLLAVIGLYWSGLILYNKQGAFIAALLFSTSFLLIFESHMAKTDAALCAASVWAFGAILRLRAPQQSATHSRAGLILWVALGCGVILKGPILPAIVITAWITIIIWEMKLEKNHSPWATIFNPLGLCLFGLIVIPWYIMIYKATGGTFFSTAISSDLTPKLTGSQETHGGLPGYYALTMFVTLWPAAIFLLSSLAYGLKAAKASNDTSLNPSYARWLLAWIIPFWIILELTPTKLPHYVLPLFPAIALLMAGAVMDMNRHKSFPKTRYMGALIFFIVSASLIFIVAGADAYYGENNLWVYGLAVIILLLALMAMVWACQGHIIRSLVGTILTGLGLSIPTYAQIMPNLNRLRIAPNIAATIQQHNEALSRNDEVLIRSSHFTEPSLVYYHRGQVLFGDKADDYNKYPAQAGQIWIIDAKITDSAARLKVIQDIATYNEMCLSTLGDFAGMNYSNGNEVDIRLYTIKDCKNN